MYCGKALRNLCKTLNFNFYPDRIYPHYKSGIIKVFKLFKCCLLKQNKYFFLLKPLILQLLQPIHFCINKNIFKIYLAE